MVEHCREEAKHHEDVGDVVYCDKRPSPHPTGCSSIHGPLIVEESQNTVARTFSTDKRVLALIETSLHPMSALLFPGVY